MACTYLKILILPDQLLPGKDLIGLDALKAVPSLFILKKNTHNKPIISKLPVTHIWFFCHVLIV